LQFFFLQLLVYVLQLWEITI